MRSERLAERLLDAFYLKERLNSAAMLSDLFGIIYIYIYIHN